MPAYKDEKTGTWFVKFYVKDQTGANKQVKKRGFATKRESLEYERSYKVRQESNLDMTFEDFFKIYSEDSCGVWNKCGKGYEEVSGGDFEGATAYGGGSGAQGGAFDITSACAGDSGKSKGLGFMALGAERKKL